MSEYALRLASAVDTAPRVRAGDAAVRFPGGTVRARGGVRNDGGGVVTAVNGTMSVSCTPFTAWVDAAVAGQVGVPYVLDAAATLSIANGHASLSRTDVVAVVVRENAYDGSGATTATLEVVQGTPGAGAPSLPYAAVALRNIVVPANTAVGTGGLTAANISTDRRVFTVASGGLLPVASSTERDALVSPQRGWMVYREDGTIQVRTASGWDTFKAYDANAVQRVVKALDESVANTTYQDDDDLKFTVVAGQSYIFEMVLLLSHASSSAVDAKVTFTFPTGSLMFAVAAMDPSAPSGYENLGKWAGQNRTQTSGGSSVQIGVAATAGSTDGTTAIIKGSFVATANGTVQLRWAENNSSATPIKVVAGSYMVAERV